LKVIKNHKRYIALGLLIIIVTLPFFTIGESQRTPVDNLIIQAEETVVNTEELVEQTVTPIVTPIPQTQTPNITSTPTPTPILITNNSKPTNWGWFKSFEHYTSISLRGSLEYQISHKLSHTDTMTGIRIIIENSITYYCIAIGTGWGYKVGDRLLITLDTGNSFYAIMTDTKSNAHTKSDNKTMITDNSVVEFIVGGKRETNKFSWRRSGTLSSIPMFKGGIVNITKV
jgi:hypothetical protein